MKTVKSSKIYRSASPEKERKELTDWEKLDKAAQLVKQVRARQKDKG